MFRSTCPPWYRTSAVLLNLVMLVLAFVAAFVGPQERRVDSSIVAFGMMPSTAYAPDSVIAFVSDGSWAHTWRTRWTGTV